MWTASVFGAICTFHPFTLGLTNASGTVMGDVLLRIFFPLFWLIERPAGRRASRCSR